MFRIFWLAMLMVTCASCVTTEGGKKIDTAAESRLQVGVTTENDAISWFGQPIEVRHDDKGETGFIYVHIVSHGNGFTGNGHADNQTLALTFGADGKLLRFKTSGTAATSHVN